ncbi:TetR/AcrR family transcriptional regulator [Clostridium oryzae]|uniref:HTH-type transcriptional regulator AcrR n=1 Tax=Clostridium oryzae TaxID=1450648 RepID=A0A1V4IRJ0_9CLOT|nr:TetR/AcrR family transcriptional regulator [Clostridium oryzae]OPJ62430.1 HTH-type transcriptional regulator AcrR [Clostridium oryzae]
MNKMTNRAKQAETTKKKIYKCGVKLMTKYGFDKISVEQISKAAGVSVGTYYYYFKSKFDLFKEIYKQGDDYFLNEVKGKLKSNDCQGQIIEFFDEYAKFNIENGIDMVKKLYTSDNKMFITHGRAMQQILQEIIETFQKQGEISEELSSAEITRILFIAARGVIYNWCLCDGELNLYTDMRIIISKMLNGIL